LTWYTVQSMKMHLIPLGCEEWTWKRWKKVGILKSIYCFFSKAFVAFTNKRCSLFEQSCFIKVNDPNLMFLTNRNWAITLILHFLHRHIKGIRGAKVKVLFQGLHVTYDIHVLVYNLKFCMFHTQFTMMLNR
jgi:hypothetical protein